MDINYGFEKLLLENDLFSPRYHARKTMLDFFSGLKSCLNSYDRIIIVGDTDVCDRLLACSGIETQVAAIADPGLGNSTSINGRVKQIRGIHVIPLDAAAEYEDVLFLMLDSSISKHVFNTVVACGKKLFSIYDNIELLGAEVLSEYLEWSIPYASQYERIMFDRRKFETSVNGVLKKYYLEKLIYDFLLIKDFISARRYMEIYQKEGFDKDGNIEKACTDVEKLLSDITTELKGRSHFNDIIMIWNDALRFDELKGMNYLGNIAARNSLFFSNAYTTVNDTRGAIASVFQKRYQIDDFERSDDDCDVENSLLISELKKHGYVLKACFDTNLSNKMDTTSINLYEPGSLKLWKGINYLLQSDSPVFLLVHELAETHNPYHCPYLNQDYYFIRGCDRRDYQNQIETSKKYWDEQLEFYMNLLDYKNSKILMSDHGQPLDLSELCTPKFGFIEDYTHVTLMVSGPKIKPAICNKLFSLIHFCELIRYVINPNEENYIALFTEYAFIQAIDRYNPGDIKRKLEDGTDKRHLMAFRAVRTEKDMFVLLANGEEYYFILPDDQTDRHENTAYADRIARLRLINGSRFLDISNLQFFEAARQLYN